MIETNEISIQQARAFRFLQQAKGKWITARELAKGADVAERSARMYAKRFVDLGIADQAELFPGHRYRLSTVATKRNVGYMKRIEAACEVFGI